MPGESDPRRSNGVGAEKASQTASSDDDEPAERWREGGGMWEEEGRVGTRSTLGAALSVPERSDEGRAAGGGMRLDGVPNDAPGTAGETVGDCREALANAVAAPRVGLSIGRS